MRILSRFLYEIPTGAGKRALGTARAVGGPGVAVPIGFVSHNPAHGIAALNCRPKMRNEPNPRRPIYRRFSCLECANRKASTVWVTNITIATASLNNM